MSAPPLAPDTAPTPPARDLLAWLTLALATLAILWPLGLTHRVLAGVDALTYFTPYWAYRMAELRAGQMPLWNPYLFLGVPFLANPAGGRALSAALAPLLAPARAGADLVSAPPRMAGRRLHLHLRPTVAAPQPAGRVAGGT